MTAPLVSLLVPAFNAAPWLAQTLESLLAQTWPACEIIVVDDGSTDGTGAVAARYVDRGVRVLHQTNQGGSAALNTAYAHSRGDYISFFDADDLMSPDKIERQMQVFLAEKTDDFITTCAWARFHDDPEEAVFRPQALWRDMDPIDWLVTAWENHLMMHPATWLLPRRLVERAGPWDPATSLYNDHEYYCRVMLQCRLVKFVPDVRTWYRSGLAGSLSSQKSRKAWESMLYVLEKSSDALLAVEDSPRTRRACAAKMQRFVHDLYPAHPDLTAAATRRVKALDRAMLGLVPAGGPLFHAARRVFGWKAAKRLQRRLDGLRRRNRERESGTGDGT